MHWTASTCDQTNACMHLNALNHPKVLIKCQRNIAWTAACHAMAIHWAVVAKLCRLLQDIDQPFKSHLKSCNIKTSQSVMRMSGVSKRQLQNAHPSLLCEWPISFRFLYSRRGNKVLAVRCPCNKKFRPAILCITPDKLYPVAAMPALGLMMPCWSTVSGFTRQGLQST